MSAPFFGLERREYLAIALVSAAVLIFEIVVTRLLSVLLWYHFAFLAVSLAMLGLGAPGVWFALRPPRRELLWRVLVAASVLVPAAVAFVIQVGAWLPPPGSTLRFIGFEVASSSLRVTLVALALLVAFLATGASVCMLLLRGRGRRIGRMYAADLLGAAVGAAAVVPLLHVVPTPLLLAALGFLPLLAALLLRPSAPWLPSVIAALLLGVVLWGEPFRVSHSKGYAEDRAGVVYEVWTPTARLTVFPDVFWMARQKEQGFGWGMGARYRAEPIEQMWIEQDASAGTPITRLRGSVDELEHLFFDVTSVGYQLRPPESACVIGAGGGRDVLTALGAGAERVHAVELNPKMVEIATDVFGDYSGRVYGLPGVETFVREGRSFLSESEDHYDLIQISLIDSWAATTAGAYALSENYLYTLEALDLYLDRTSPQGIISISRWMRGLHQMEAVRLVLLAQAALENRGFEDPARHMVVVGAGAVATLLVSKAPFEERDLESLDAIVEERGFVVHWPPHTTTPEGSLVREVLSTGPTRLAARGLTLDPPTDERPFFFQTVRAFDRLAPGLMDSVSFNEEAARLPGMLLAAVSLATALLFFAPFARARGFGRSPGFGRGSAYFVGIGLGFMLVEVPLLQKSILYLGHPSYATTVVLAVLLVGSGIGAAASSRLASEWAWRGRFVLPAATLAMLLVSDPVQSATLGWALPGRIAVCMALFGPLGVVLGFAFPVGMVHFGDANRAWFWALNGAAGVVSSVATLALGPYLGLSGLVLLGVAAYAAAALALVRRPIGGEGPGANAPEPVELTT